MALKKQWNECFCPAHNWVGDLFQSGDIHDSCPKCGGYFVRDFQIGERSYKDVPDHVAIERIQKARYHQKNVCVRKPACLTCGCRRFYTRRGWLLHPEGRFCQKCGSRRPVWDGRARTWKASPYPK